MVDKRLVNYLTRTRTDSIRELEGVEAEIDTLQGKRRAISMVIDGLSAQLQAAQNAKKPEAAR
jgi:hypothetical protein